MFASLEAVGLHPRIKAARGGGVRALANPVVAAEMAAVDGTLNGVSSSTHAIPHRAGRFVRFVWRLCDANGSPRTVGGAVFRRGAMTVVECKTNAG